MSSCSSILMRHFAAPFKMDYLEASSMTNEWLKFRGDDRSSSRKCHADNCHKSVKRQRCCCCKASQMFSDVFRNEFARALARITTTSRPMDRNSCARTFTQKVWFVVKRAQTHKSTRKKLNTIVQSAKSKYKRWHKPHQLKSLPTTRSQDTRIFIRRRNIRTLFSVQQSIGAVCSDITGWRINE